MSHLETIWAAKFAKTSFNSNKIEYNRQRWLTPDGDFIDVDFIKANQKKCRTQPLWVLFHGLEGSSQSHYAKAFANYAIHLGIDFCIPHFRGCSGDINLAPRAYHSGDFEEIHWIISRLKQNHPTDIYVVGISLGGNALMRWAGEMGEQALVYVRAITSVCSPLDMVASGHHLARGLNRYIYTPMFLSTMKKNASLKLKQFPGLFNESRMLNAKTLHEFDEVFTAPLHGFKSADDYWLQASAKPLLCHVAVPALVINPLNDPFIPVTSLPKQSEVSSSVVLWKPEKGGHVGFVEEVWSKFPGHVMSLPQTVGQFFATGEASDA
jgi:predicted alpha/beta-fold hydrolase